MDDLRGKHRVDTEEHFGFYDDGRDRCHADGQLWPCDAILLRRALAAVTEFWAGRPDLAPGAVIERRVAAVLEETA